jgi:general secretion pathway protein G
MDPATGSGYPERTGESEMSVCPKKNTSKGFTLIELVIVMTLIGIIVGMGLPQYRNSIRKAKETALKENLYIMRNLLNQYYTDKKKFPMSLQMLVDEGYLKVIPRDPLTDSHETWEEVPEELTEDDLLSGVIPGIADVRSGSDQLAIDGTPYNTW